MSSPDIIPANHLRGPSMRSSSDMILAKAVMRSSRRRSGDLRHRIAQHAGSDRVALGMVGIQEAV